MKKTWAEIKQLRQMGVACNTAHIIPDAKEVIFNIISCMCDNRSRLRFLKRKNGKFMIQYFGSNGTPYAISNMQMDGDEIDLMWKADEKKWKEIAEMVETGTVVVESIQSR